MQYHPKSNGLAERAVRTLKDFMSKNNKGDLTIRIQRFLYHYWTTKHSITVETPAKLIFQRELRIHLHLLKPNLVDAEQARKKNYDVRITDRHFDIGDIVQILCLNVKNHTGLEEKLLETRDLSLRKFNCRTGNLHEDMQIIQLNIVLFQSLTLHFSCGNGRKWVSGPSN